MSVFLTAMMAMATSPGSAEASAITVTAPGSKASAAGPADYFTGTVRIDAPFQRSAPARVGGPP